MSMLRKTAARVPARASSLAMAAGAVALLGASAWYVKRQRTRVEAENPPAGRFVEVDGVRLHYTEHGDAAAPPLVLLHGMGMMGQEMELSGLVERAAQQYHVFVFDRPGYGHSTRPSGRLYTPDEQARLFLQALTLLGVHRPVVLAHSWATLVAVAMAEQAPSELKGLVLVGGYYTPAPRFDVLINSLPAVPLLGPLMANTLSPLFSRAIWGPTMWRVFSPGDSAVRRDFNARYPKWMTLRPLSIQTAAAEAAMLIPASIQQRAQHRRMQVPVVLVAGEHDRLITSGWHSGRVNDRMPQSRLHIVPGAGHMVHHTAPDVVFDAVREVSSLVTPDTPVDLEAPARMAPEDIALQPAA
ncbi:alpha/beta hydrolase [uncultured Aquabacterium sp.]|uniref:alpha/beta fold hydrolase n=1 Tax=uncultured Aquabacterium sp. TaxID=158753 RepID=UPI00262C3571|nr:alpha/beta hydrolase [uncultured Aquabacterium sp.]